MKYKCVSFNIKCDDTIADLSEEKLWKNRQENVANEILELNADLIGLQEVMPHQYDYLKDKLQSRYGSVYCSRDVNAQNGEGCPIFYDLNKFELLEEKTFWLSETPDVHASISWNSRWPRICTYVILKDKTSNKTLAFFNTHLDHKSDDARTNGVKLILSIIEKYNLPTIMMGDFNSTKQNMAYQIASQNLCDVNINNDESITFHLWGHPEILESGKTNIDYVFEKGFAVKTYKVIDDIENAILISDHYAILTELEL